MRPGELAINAEIISSAPGTPVERMRTGSHYRLVWCGVLDGDQAEIAAGARRVSYDVCTVEGSYQVRLPRLVVEVLKQVKPSSLRGMSPARFDGTLDYGYLVLHDQAEAEKLARLLLKFAEAVARRSPQSFGFLSLEIEASEWHAPVDTPLEESVSGKVLFAVQIKNRGGEVLVGKRVTKSVDVLGAPAKERTIQAHAHWVC